MQCALQIDVQCASPVWSKCSLLNVYVTQGIRVLQCNVKRAFSNIKAPLLPVETFNHLLCIAQPVRLFAVVLVCISCLSRLLAFLCLPFAQAQSLGVFSCDSKAYLRVFSSNLNTHLTPSYPAYSNIALYLFCSILTNFLL